MSNLTTVVNNIISKVNTHTTDLSNKATQISTHIPLSGITAYHLLQGNLAVSASTITQGFNTTLYTGNGGTQSINTGIDMNTQWGNDASEKFGGLVWQKYRSVIGDNTLIDSIRGAGNYISSNTTGVQGTDNNSLSSFTSNGFNIGTSWSLNGATAASWNFQTTHRVSGTTNHGKPYTCHYNPFTGFTIVKYEGSGIAGHEIPHHLGRKLGFWSVKNLSSSANWYSQTESIRLLLNVTDAGSTTVTSTITDDNLSLVGGNLEWNTSSNSYILYGWANSYSDKSNKLIGNYEIGVYQGTGVSGNKVTTRGKPAWLMTKLISGTGNWRIVDNKRNEVSATNDGRLYANLSDAEVATAPAVTFNSDGFTLDDTGTDANASGGQYLYMVAYDTNSNGGGSYYPLASDTANVQVNNALIPIAQGIDSNGAKNIILSKNETFSGVTYTQGKNYVYYDALGNRGVSNKAPNYGLTNPSNGGDFYNVLSNKWFTSAGTEITNGRNYLNHIVYADNDGGLLYVEELPKVEYKDIIKANEFIGKNACTAWVNFDGTTTPPTIRDSYNVGSVVRIDTGYYGVYFKEEMNNTNFSVVSTSSEGTAEYNASASGYFLNKALILTRAPGNTVAYNDSQISVQIFGGKN